MLVIVIGYHEDSGEAVDGTVLPDATNDRHACARALAWVTDEAKDSVGGWRAFELVPEWGPGREINPIDSDYA